MTYTLIQAIRGLLSAGVMIAHGIIFLGKYGDPQYFNHVPTLMGGIPCMFFAISGFFMAMLVDRKSQNFLPQRLLRVYPTYFIIVALAFILRGLTKMPLSFSDLYATLPLLPFGGRLDYKLGIEWTMLYEVTFYFICALFCRPNWYHRFPAFLIGWFMAVLAGAYFLPVPPMPNFLNIWLSIWDIGFVGGALVYYLLKKDRSAATLRWAAIVSAVSLAVVLTLPWGHVNLLLVISLGSCVLLILLVKLEEMIRSPKFLVTLGDSSYALYLVHVTIILLTFDMWTRYTGRKPEPPAAYIAYGLCLLVSWPLGKMDVSLHKRLKKYFSERSKRRKAERIRLAAEAEAATMAGAPLGKVGE